MQTTTDEAKEIRDEIAKLRPGPGRKYGPALRRRVVEWYRRAVEAGIELGEVQRLIGVPLPRVEKWIEEVAASVPPPSTPSPGPHITLQPVVVRDELPFGPLISFTTPGGFRISGLTLEQAVGLLKAFA